MVAVVVETADVDESNVAIGDAMTRAIVDMRYTVRCVAQLLTWQ